VADDVRSEFRRDQSHLEAPLRVGRVGEARRVRIVRLCVAPRPFAVQFEELVRRNGWIGVQADEELAEERRPDLR
jgi:hypothetical protein